MGGMFEQLPGESIGGGQAPCAAEWVKEENQTALRLRVDRPGLKLTKTVRLKDETTVEVNYQVSSGTAGAPVEAVYSFPATSGGDRATRLCWLPTGSVDAPSTASAAGEPACKTFVPGQKPEELPGSAQRLEMSTPGRPGVAVEWKTGQVSIEMKNYSVLLRARIPAASGDSEVSQGTMRLRMLPAK